jgi:hypothetical protein
MFRATFRPLPGTTVPDEMNLKRWLKAMLRQYSFRCVLVEELDDDPTNHPSVESLARQGAPAG